MANPRDLLLGNTQNSSPENEDIPTDRTDFLKVRAYLYKFTPEIKFVGRSGQQDFGRARAEAARAQLLVNKANPVRVKIQELIGNLSALNLYPRNQSLNAFLMDFRTALVKKSLEIFLKLPKLSEVLPEQRRLLIVYQEKTTAEGAAVAEPVLIEAGQAYTYAKNLANNLNRDATITPEPTTVISAIAQEVDQLLKALRSIDGAIGSIVEPPVAAVKKLQQDIQAQVSDLGHFQVSRFVYDLNTKDLSRFDLSRYISQYQVDQQLGTLSPGRLSAATVLQNEIIPFINLSENWGPGAIRRPIFFPNGKGDYTGYVNGIPTASAAASSPEEMTKDPISSEHVSTLNYNDLVERIAMGQTLEDNGGNEQTDRAHEGSPYLRDVDRINIAMRLRGIKDSRKRELIIKFFRTGLVDEELVKRASTKKILGEEFFSRVSHNVATDELARGGVTPLGVSAGLTEVQQGILNKMSGITPGDLKGQLAVLKDILTDPSVDGILVSDLVQKYDFFSIFVYKHEVSPDVIEEVLEGNTGDPYFFDKESLFMYTPSSYFLNREDSTGRHFATYSPEFNGFVADTHSQVAAGSVNLLSLNLVGSMGLMGATQKIYNATIFENSVFDAAELSDESLFNLYQNLYQDKDPFEILTTLLESLYQLRVSFPDKEVTLSDSEKSGIIRSVKFELAGSSLTQSAIDAQAVAAVKKREEEVKRARTRGAKTDYVRRADGHVVSFLDILSQRAFNQFGEKTKKGVEKGPKHLFNMASYLYANVMRSRRFNVRVAANEEVRLLDIKSGGLGNTGGVPLGLTKNANGFEITGVFDPYHPRLRTEQKNLFLLNKETDGSGGSILEVSPVLPAPSLKGSAPLDTEARAWKAYFLFLSQSFGDFVADVKDGFTIMNDVTNSCYLELYETPGGRFIFRTPQYNNRKPIYRTVSQDGFVRVLEETRLVIESDGTARSKSVDREASGTAHMLTSEDIIPISAEYGQTVKDLISKQQMGYGADLIGVPIPQLYYFYSNGKAVAQYGLIMSEAITNPNVRFVPKEKLESLEVEITPSSYAMGIFHYCRFFLEYSNLNKFTGTITAVGDPKIQVGRTYFDIVNQKFGYITQVAKSLEVGGSYTVTFNLIAVRDAVYDRVVTESGDPDGEESIGRPSFRLLPEMESFVPRFINSSETLKNRPPVQASSPLPGETTIPYEQPISPNALPGPVRSLKLVESKFTK